MTISGSADAVPALPAKFWTSLRERAGPGSWFAQSLYVTHVLPEVWETLLGGMAPN